MKKKDGQSAAGGYKVERVDVLVIGAGLLGCFTARNLARYEMDILVPEKENSAYCQYMGAMYFRL